MAVACRRPAERIRAVLLTLLVCSGWSGDPAHAQTAAPPSKPQAADTTGNGVASMPVPGGTAALLAAAGLDPSRPRVTALLDIIRVVHRVPEGIEPALDERRAR